MISFFIKYRYAVAVFTLFTASLGGFFVLKTYYRSQGYNACRTEFALKTATKARKRHEIANNRPDTAQFLDGLLNDSNW